MPSMGTRPPPWSFDPFISGSARQKRASPAPLCISLPSPHSLVAFGNKFVAGSSRLLPCCCSASGDFQSFKDPAFYNRSDSTNGAFDAASPHEHPPQNKRVALFEKLLQALQHIQSFLPGGTWWRLNGVIRDDDQQISFLSAMRRFWPLIAPDIVIVGVAFFALVVAALSEIAIPHYVAATIFSSQNGLRHEFFKNAKYLAVMSFTFGLFSGLRGGCFGVANQILVRRMREKLFFTMLNQDIAFFDKETVGILTSRLGSDCQQVSRIISNDLNIMLRNALQGIGSLLYLTTISLPLALSTVIICTTMWCIMTLYGRYQRVAAKSVQDLVASANEVAEESLSLARVVRTFGTEKQEFARYSKWCKQLVSVNLRQNVAYGLWNWSSNTLYNATQVVALIIGGSFVLTGNISAEQLTKSILYSEWVVHSTWWVGDHWASLMQSIGASEKVFELMDLPASKQLTGQGTLLNGHLMKLKFHHAASYQSRLLSFCKRRTVSS